MDMIFHGMSMSLFQAKQQWSRTLLLPTWPLCARGARAGFSLALRHAGNQKRKQAGDVADLQTCDQHGDFKKRAHQAVLAISGPDADRKEEETARRDEYQNLEKPPENRPQQDAPD